MRSLWNRLVRPWSRGTIVIVTAMVTAAVVVVVTRYEAGFAGPPPPTERSWVDVDTTVYGMVDDHGLRSEVDRHFPDSFTDLPGMYVFQPGHGHRPVLATVPAGHYDLYAACMFTEETMMEVEPYLDVALQYGEQGNDGLDFSVDCGRPAQPVGQEIAQETAFGVSVNSWPGGASTVVAANGDDVFTVTINGATLDATHALRLVFVPKGG